MAEKTTEIETTGLEMSTETEAASDEIAGVASAVCVGKSPEEAVLQDYFKKVHNTFKEICIAIIIALLGTCIKLGTKNMLPEKTGTAILLACIAVTIACLLVAKKSLTAYYELRSRMTFTRELSEQLVIERDMTKIESTRGVTIGVLFCVLGLIIMLLSQNETEPGEISIFTSMILFVFSALSLWMFLVTGTKVYCYDFIMKSHELTEAGKVKIAAASIVWPLTIAGFVIWSVSYDGFSQSWMLFLVVGILYGAFCGLVDAWQHAVLKRDREKQCENCTEKNEKSVDNEEKSC